MNVSAKCFWYSASRMIGWAFGFGCEWCGYLLALSPSSVGEGVSVIELV
jgi:hypothetical protein